MLAHQYQVWPKLGWGDDLDPNDPKEKRYVGITTVAKRDRDSAFEVFNELVAMRLGQLMGLPIPPGVIVENDGKTFYCSAHVSAASGDLPNADLERFAADKEDDACGVMVFDAWIANCDRHDENLWYDYYGNKCFLFDHGMSLLGGSGRTALTSNRDRLAIRVDSPCLAEHLQSLSFFDHWHSRICDIPAHAIRSAVRDAASVGVDEALAHECGEWLLVRRGRLPQLFRNQRNDFPKVRPTLFDPFQNNDDCSPEYHI